MNEFLKEVEEVKVMIFERAKKGLELVDLDYKISELQLKRDQLAADIESLDEMIDAGLDNLTW